MKPSWMKVDQDRANTRKVRVIANMKETDVRDDQDRENDYQQLMEDTGRSY